jgi:CelD/BcsL family acetyltransferase involved in cellulose biosynthesis
VDTNIAGFEIAELTTIDSLERLRPEWSALWTCCSTATPFQSPEWLIPWWRHIGEGELWTLAVRHTGRLIGLAPFYIYVQPGTSLRQLFLLGIATTDYLDALFEPQFGEAGAAAVFTYLERAAQRWDVCDLQDLRPESPLLKVSISNAWQQEVTVQSTCPVLTLPATVADLRGILSPQLYQNLGRFWRRLQKLGNVCVECAAHDNLDELLESLLRLHAAHWSLRGELGVLAPAGVQRSLRETAAGLLALGVLRLYGLRLDERIVATFYGFTHAAAGKPRAYFYLSGFDPLLAHLRLGWLIMDHAVRAAIHEGAAEFDFLRGAEAYKYRWGAQDSFTYRRRLFTSETPTRRCN